ncbi:MAG: MFS transporter [Pseudomonadales bacterium]|nr:MFS transporter [Pseudomonadales bacterium]
MMQFFLDVKDSLNNKNYRFLLIGYVLLSATLGTRDTIGLHMNTYFWELVPSQIRFFAVAPLMGPVIAFLVAAKLHSRFDKKPTIIGGLLLLCTFSAAPVVLRIIDFFPGNHTTWLFPTLLTMATLAMISGAILLISVMSALADVADDHELNTGRRQEGIFYASRSFFAKASSGLGHLIAGIALDVINFPEGAEPGTIDPEIVFRLGLVDGPIAIIPGFIAVAFYIRYNLTKDRHAEIQAELRKRYAERDAARA